MPTKADYLKLALDNGVIVVDGECTLELNRVTKRYTMYGLTGDHSLSSVSPSRRILLHWNGFVNENKSFNIKRLTPRV